MTFPSKIIAAGLAAAIALPAAAFAQDSRPEPQSPRAAPAAQAGTQPDAASARPGGRWAGQHRSDRPSALWNVASRLAAAELALGITPEQRDAWSAFSTAAIAFSQAGRPARPGPAAPADPAAGDSADAAQSSTGPFARADRMLDRSIARGAAAADLKDAMSTLAAQLTPEQTATAERLLRELPRPGHGAGGTHHHRRG
ncbi:Spy/CpxP family protein refolding chaperone [Aureimonas frigidaquae]|uniref:Spy/CpxP family protein refolding chaperone n=1 Tax=Aureimonas frigidaquae TaxID=424757 RepID=UPI00078057BF|nr:Spy/CpxP family protein refolding chaperone [Aureimonas frigidaquae]